jgi:DNA-directed RNA polymerase specialized sigma24 family protein
VVVDLPPFQQLLDEHAAALHRFCVAQAGPDHGPDCFQEAVIAALRAYPGLRSASNLRGWLFTIAHRKVVDHHRAVARRPVTVPDLEGPAPAAPFGADDELWAAVGRLPDKQRHAVALRFLGDLPYADIAAAMDTSEAAARQNVRAALAGLRSEVTR